VESPLESGSPLGASAQSLWDAYVRETTMGVTLQSECKPQQINPQLAPQQTAKGVVVLYHGFTACPQQFLELGGKLANAGFIVLLPLLPGHGRPRTAENANDDLVDGIPTDGESDEYGALARRMNGVVAAVKADVTRKVVGGISVGGAVATSALEASPTLYTRGILFTPFFQVSGALRWALAGANALGGGVRRSWGEGCENERRAGRAFSKITKAITMQPLSRD